MPQEGFRLPVVVATHPKTLVTRWTPFLLAVAALLGAACRPCSTVTASLLQNDGGPFRCVTAEDCPRTGNDNVCVTTTPPDYTSTCVSCAATLCMRETVSCP